MLFARIPSGTSAAGQLIISEVAPWSSGSSPFKADWFEVTNIGNAPMNITGWTMDDNSNGVGNPDPKVPLTGITSIAAGESVIFIEGTGITDLTGLVNSFKSTWFGTHPPANLQVGTYSGGGVGLSTGSDAVNLFDGSGTLQANVTFGASPSSAPFASFNNTAGINNGAISTLSAIGVNGAFAAAGDVNEVGSPGVIGKLFISEVAPWSSGSSPFKADWFEVTNTTSAAINISGWKMDDSSNGVGNPDPKVALAGISSISPGESVIFIEGTGISDLASLVNSFKSTWFGTTPPAGLQVGTYSGGGVGLSTGGDAVNLFDSSGNLMANVTFSASPAGPSFPTFDNAAGLNNGPISLLSVAGTSGAFTGSADVNEIGSPGSVSGTTTVTPPPPVASVKINEVESNGGRPADWVELVNTGTSTADISAYFLMDSTHSYTLPPSTTIAVGAYLALDQSQFGFDLPGFDTLRLVATDGTTTVDTFSWLEHSSVTYGRCPDAAGPFITTLTPTKGAANTTACPSYASWPGGASIDVADSYTFGGNLSGLIYEGTNSATPGVLWAVKNGPGTLYRLLWNSATSTWAPDPNNGWANGKALHYPNGSGDPDSEGVTLSATGSAGGVFVSTERDNNVPATSRPAILRFDVSGSTTSLNATNDWNLTTDLPPLGSNLGAEGVTWVPDTFLTGHNFVDESKGGAYSPSTYGNHGGGIFFAGIENDGFIYGYALDQSGSGFTRVATIDSGFPGVMEVQFDRELKNFWAVCDDTCQGRSAILQIDGTGRFAIDKRYERPGGMPNFNNEGFAMASEAECVNGLKPAFWSDDTEDGGHALRQGTVNCVGVTQPTVTITGGPSGPTKDASPTFTFTAANAPGGVVCSIDTASPTDCAGGSYPASAQPEGPHTFTVSATGGPGTTPAKAMRDFTVDTTPPDTSIDMTPPDPSGANVTFTFSSNEADTFECNRDSAGFAVCVSPLTLPALPDGQHTLQVRAIDLAGNTDPSPDSFTWTVDTTPPDTTIATGPNGTLKSGQGSFTFTSTETMTTFQCSLDSPVFETCSSPFNFSGLTNGGHIFAVQAVDAAGNIDPTPASRGWTVNDGTAPKTQILTFPPKFSNSASASFTFQGTDNSGATTLHFECRLDATAASPWLPCTSPVNYSNLAEGPHAFEVRAGDNGANVDKTPATRTWTVDLTKPVLAAVFTQGSAPYVPGTWATGKVTLTITCTDPGASNPKPAHNLVKAKTVFANGITDVPAQGVSPNDCVDKAGNVATPIGPWQVKVDTRQPSCTASPSRLVIGAIGGVVSYPFNLAAADNLTAAYTLAHASVVSAVGDNGAVAGDITTSPIDASGQTTISVNAVVGGPAKSRTYTITFGVTDEAGNANTCVAKIVVR